jgi:hypothetical protein
MDALLPFNSIKFTRVKIFIFCCLMATAMTAEANGDLTVSGVILGDDLAIANLDFTAFANGGKLTTNLDGLVVCADDDNSSGALSALVARVEALEADNIALKADNVTLKAQVASLQAALDANTDADDLAHHGKYTDAEAVAAVGERSITALISPHYSPM